MTNRDKAKLFATAAHAAVGQVRKYTGEPYIVHPIEVARIVAAVFGTDAMIQAAYLHDVLEDTNVPESVLRHEFGDEVTNIVVGMTNVSEPGHGNRAFRKNLDLQALACQPAEVQTVKLADLISNTRSIVQYDPDFAVVYLAEKRLLLDVLINGHPKLWLWANRELTKGEELLGKGSDA